MYPPLWNTPSRLRKELGCFYKEKETRLELWAPLAQKVQILLYSKDHLNHPEECFEMTKKGGSCWRVCLKGDWKNWFYRFRISFKNKIAQECCDPWNPLCGRDNHKSQINDIRDSHPLNWLEDRPLDFPNPQNALIYELHLRDFSSDREVPFQNRGKFKSLMESPLNREGLPLGLDYIQSLGVSHIQLLPILDYASSPDDSTTGDDNYNWGYDPRHFFALKGQYSSNPSQPLVGIKELKQLVQELHKRKMGLILDVVYNHTFSLEHPLELITPGYWHRRASSGELSNGSGCGNELASERPMVRRMILDSLCYLAEEFHVDGFRLDLMGLLDRRTLRKAAEKLRKIHPDILLYGEGWTAGETPLKKKHQGILSNWKKLPDWAFFNDLFRDGAKGSVFHGPDQGFLNGNPQKIESLQQAGRLMMGQNTWPCQSIQYLSCHDNLTLWDKLTVSQPHWSEETKKKVLLQCVFLLCFSPGIPFLQGGMELGRSKSGDSNSYKSGDEINQFPWSQTTSFNESSKALAFWMKTRREQGLFQSRSRKEMDLKIQYLPSNDSLLKWLIQDRWLCMLNPLDMDKELSLPEGSWERLTLLGENIMIEKEILKIEAHGWALLKQSEN